MYSTFEVNSENCLICNNGIMKELGKLQGVFGADIDFIKNRIVVNHTDEVTREQIAERLKKLGFNEKKNNCQI